MPINDIIFTSDQLATQHVEYARQILADPGVRWGIPSIDKKVLPLRGVSGDLAVILGRPGDGKCLGRGTPVLMFDGRIVPVEDIVVGDLLMGPDSMPRTVVSLARGVDEMYEVIPVRGDPYVVNSDHILSLQMSRMTKGDEDGRIVNISVKDYIDQSAKWKHHAKGYRVGVDWPEQEVPIDPYFLGLWLGDGTSSDHTITNPDEEVAEWLMDFARKYRYDLHDNSSEDRCLARRTTKRVGVGRRNIILDTLRNMGVINNKHIPYVYLANSKNVRLQLLAGILDTDGHLGRGYFSITQKRKELMDGILFLARSLGLAANRMRDRVVNGVRYCRASISGDIDMIPTKIARKQAGPRRQVKNVLRTGIKIKPVGIDQYYGFELDGPDGLFLLGDFTVTHNTSCLLAHAVNQMREIKAAGREDEEAVLFCTWEGTVDKLYAAAMAGYGGYSKTDFLWGRVPISQVETAAARHGVMPIIFVGFSSFRKPSYKAVTLDMVHEAAEAIQSGYKISKRKIRALYLDYAQIIKVEGARNRTEQTMEATIGTKDLCVRLALPGFMGAQAGRQVDEKNIKIAEAADAQHSSQIEQHVDEGFSAWRPWRTEPQKPGVETIEVYGRKVPFVPRLCIIKNWKNRDDDTGFWWPLYLAPEYLALAEMEEKLYVESVSLDQYE